MWTEGENEQKNLRFRMKTYTCGRGLNRNIYIKQLLDEAKHDIKNWAIPFNICTPPVEEPWNSSGVAI